MLACVDELARKQEKGCMTDVSKCKVMLSILVGSEQPEQYALHYLWNPHLKASMTTLPLTLCMGSTTTATAL